MKVSVVSPIEPRHPGARRAGLAHIRAACVTLTALSLAGCSSTPKPPEPVSIRVELSASEALNPDINGRPSPVAVRLFRLRDTATFSSTDYFTLAERDEAVLAGDLLHREAFMISPGESSVRDYQVELDGRALAVLVGYRDLEASVWRQVAVIPEPKAPWLELPEFLRWSRKSLDYAIRLEASEVKLSAPAAQ